MSRPTVEISAAKSNRSLVLSAPERKALKADAPLKFWRRLIDSAVADAKRTVDGIPTYSAIMARWWIEENRPTQADKEEWATSFACACSWLSLDVEEERKVLSASIEMVLLESYVAFVKAVVYKRKAAALSCAGFPKALGRQYIMPLVADADYEQIAGVEHGDPAAVTRLLELRAA